MLKEINGRHLTGEKAGQPLSSFTEMKADGSTDGGCWIYTGLYADGVNQTARRKPGSEQNWLAPEWGWAWPANRRVLYNRASADPDGKPWSETKALVWWDEDAQKWVGHDVPDFPVTKAPSYRPEQGASGPEGLAGDDPFIMQADGKGWLYAPAGLMDGPMPTHYEPHESPVRNPLYRQQANPTRKVFKRADNPSNPSAGEPGAGRLPVRLHDLPAHRAPHRRRHEPLPALPVGAPAGVLLRGLAGARPRAGSRAPGLGDDHDLPHGDRGAGARHRPDDASALRAGPGRAPDRDALPLGCRRPGCRQR